MDYMYLSLFVIVHNSTLSISAIILSSCILKASYPISSSLLFFLVIIFIFIFYFLFAEPCNPTTIQADQNTERSDSRIDVQTEEQEDKTISSSSTISVYISTIVCNLVLYLLFRVR